VDKGFRVRVGVGGGWLTRSMEAAAIDEMSEGRLLDHVESLAAEKRRCEVEILRAAAQHAYLHDADSLGPAQVPTPGRERAVDLGGGGTPQVTEFAAAELGARLGMSSFSARALIADALDLKHRLPLLWARVERLEVQPYLARHVAQRTRRLAPEQAAYVDGRMVEFADGRLTWTRFQTRVEAMVKAADPETAASRRDRRGRPTCHGVQVGR